MPPCVATMMVRCLNHAEHTTLLYCLKLLKLVAHCSHLMAGVPLPSSYHLKESLLNHCRLKGLPRDARDVVAYVTDVLDDLYGDDATKTIPLFAAEASIPCPALHLSPNTLIRTLISRLVRLETL